MYFELNQSRAFYLPVDGLVLLCSNLIIQIPEFRRMYTISKKICQTIR